MDWGGEGHVCASREESDALTCTRFIISCSSLETIDAGYFTTHCTRLARLAQDLLNLPKQSGAMIHCLRMSFRTAIPADMPVPSNTTE
jgi:hypothetical protein